MDSNVNEDVNVNANSKNSIESLVKSIIHKKRHKLSFAIAGGGSQVISSLASTPGASSVLLTGNVLYDRSSFCQYLSQYAPTSTIPSASASTSTPDSNGMSTHNISYKNHLNQFGFASAGAAIMAAQASLKHSFTLSPSISIHEMMNCNMGVGCTSTLVSHGREHRSSRIHIALCRGDGSGTLFNVRLSAGEGDTNGNGNGNGSTSSVSSVSVTTGSGSSSTSMSINSSIDRRSRQEEDQLMAQLILSCIENYNTITNANLDGKHTNIDIDIDTDWCQDILHQNGDTIEIKSFHSLFPQQKILVDGKTPAQMAAERVIDPNDGLTDVVVISPRSDGGKQDQVDMIPLAHTVIPSDPIIFPGSFNPPHVGHVSLAQAAVRTMTKKKRDELREYFGDVVDSTMMEDLWNTSEYQSFQSIVEDEYNNDLNLDNGPFSVLFEISLTNADKPPMEASEAQRRVELFGEMQMEMQMESAEATNTNANTAMPQDWGILLTSAPLFIEKVKLIKKYLAPSLATYEHGVPDPSQPSRRQITFVIGTDTMVRIINPKYYGDDEGNMLTAVREMGDEGVHFVVGGRVEQIKGVGGADTTRFVTGEEELESLPEDVRNMFTIIKEEDFRVDISSTELRKRKSSKL